MSEVAAFRTSREWTLNGNFSRFRTFLLIISGYGIVNQQAVHERVGEAAILLKTSVANVRRLIEEGQMPRSTYSNVLAGDIGHILNALVETT